MSNVHLSNRIVALMIGVLPAVTVLASFFVANRTSITRSPTSLLPRDVGTADASDYQKPILHGGRLQFYWQVWQLLHCHPRVVQIGYQIIPQSNPPKSVLPTIHRLRFRNGQNRGYLSTQGLHNSRFLQQIVSCTKTREKMAPCDRSKCPEQFSACSYVQNGDLSNQIVALMIGVLPAVTVLASFFVGNRTSITRSPTSLLPRDVGAADASYYYKLILHGGCLQFYWQVWQLLHCHPRVVQILRFSYQIIPQSNPPKSVLPTIHRLRFRNGQNRGYLTTQGLHNSRFLQQIVSCTKTRGKMAPCDRSKCPEQFSACSYVQNGDFRDYQKLGHKRGMASFHRSEGCILSRSHTSGFSSLASFPCRQTNVPIQSSAFRVSDGTPRVHTDCKRSKTRSSPIPGRLVVKSKYQTPVSAPDKRTHPCDARIWLCDKFRKNQSLNLHKKSTFWVTISI